MATRPAVRLAATAFTHRGAVRPNNEDSVAVADWIMSATMAEPVALTRDVAAGEPTLCLVADGLGGHSAGEVASRRVAETLSRRAAEAVDEAAVAALLRDADAELFALMRERPELLGMGATVAGVAVAGPSRVVVFNVGDSRLYRLGGDGSVVQLSTDDTPGPKLDDGRTAAITTPRITQCLGGGFDGRSAGIAPHVQAEPLDDGARYLICSDGLTDVVPLDGIGARIRPDDDRATVEALFAAAMAAGGPDNISLIVLRLVPRRDDRR